MTKKHYVQLARILGQHRVYQNTQLLTTRIADILAQDNPRFNQTKFLEAIYQAQEETTHELST